MTHVITEERIIELSLLFLRKHYKLWPRVSEIEVQKHLRAEGGLVADAFLSFFQPNDSSFSAVLEATDYQKREELWFRPLWQLVFWDACALASITGSFVLLMLHLFDRLTLMHSYPWLFAGSFLLFASGLTAIIYRLLYGLRRYRYIYAIEQFKQYDATNQWVAFSWDVFPGYESPYFQELKLLCVHHGFGMLEIMPDESMKLHITPARQPPVGQKKRRIVRFITEAEWALNVRKTLRSTKWRDQVATYLGRFVETPKLDDLVRFKRPVWKQVGMCVIATSVLITVLVREYGKRPIRYVDESNYIREMVEKGSTLSEDEFSRANPVLFDSAGLVPFSPTSQPYMRIVPDSNSILDKIMKQGFLRLTSNQIKIYPCAYAVPLLSGKFVVSMGTYYDIEVVKTYLLKLKDIDVQANGLLLSCFNPRRGYYVLVLEEHFSTMEAANSASARLRAYLESKGLPIEVRGMLLE